MSLKTNIIVSVISVVSVSYVHAVEYDWPEQGTRLIGDNIIHVVRPGEHLDLLSRFYGVGLLTLMSANRDVDPYLLTPNTFVTVPQQLILPDVPYEGIVVNLAELRLYYFDKRNKKVHVFPIGIGRVGRDTPTMQTHISQKRLHPTWVPTEAIKKEYKEERGIVLPDKVEAGEENPLGDHALRLAFDGGVYSIHGTNKDFGVGLRVSAGCIRMQPSNIAWLFDRVKVGEKVKIIHQPVKSSMEPDGTFYVESHRPLSKNEAETDHRILTIPDPEIMLLLHHSKAKTDRYLSALAIQSGIPTEIGNVKKH